MRSASFALSLCLLGGCHALWPLASVGSDAGVGLDLNGDGDGSAIGPDSTGADGGPLDANPDGPPLDVSPDGRPPDGLQIDASLTDAGVGPGWVSIAKTTFTMGSPTAEPCHNADEVQHQVTLSHPFEIMTTEVTQMQFQTRMGYNPSFHQSCGPTCPVEAVNWYQATHYCNALSIQQGLGTCYACAGTGATVSCTELASYTGSAIYSCPGYRLPTEAEWELAYRAGTSTAFHDGTNTISNCSGCPAKDPAVEQIGWYCVNSGSTPHPVAQKQHNAWGLYDMAGNVLEWCHDWYGPYEVPSVTDPFGVAAGPNRVLRGGYWGGSATFLRAAKRFAGQPGYASNLIGFRCARSL